MSRKTIDLDLLVQACNNVLAIEDEKLTEKPFQIAADARSYRSGVIGVCELALQMAGAYKGFRYLSSELDGNGQLIDGYDDTRRYYYPLPE